MSALEYLQALIDGMELSSITIQKSELEELKRLLAEPAVQNVQAGDEWVLVPIKPTSAMIEAAVNADPERESVWDAYLGAAPSQPVATQEDGGNGEAVALMSGDAIEWTSELAAACRQAWNDMYHKCRPEISYNSYEYIWKSCLERTASRPSNAVQDAYTITLHKINAGERWDATARIYNAEAAKDHGRIIIRKTPQDALAAMLEELGECAATVPPVGAPSESIADCYSHNDGDSWCDCPDDIVFVHGLKVTDEMVKAYLAANDKYWHESDAMPRTSPSKFRNGTPMEATRVSLEAALAVLQQQSQEPSKSEVQ
tara:strand:- start:423633 stop:424574 length:942 start_codon:yes stop_codon:yes gene_type:complete